MVKEVCRRGVGKFDSFFASSEIPNLDLGKASIDQSIKTQMDRGR